LQEAAAAAADQPIIHPLLVRAAPDRRLAPVQALVEPVEVVARQAAAAQMRED